MCVLLQTCRYVYILTISIFLILGFIGEIKYFNKKSSKYMVSFTDGSEDYIYITKTDDLEIILL